jgi:hypothetical protein
MISRTASSLFMAQPQKDHQPKSLVMRLNDSWHPTKQQLSLRGRTSAKNGK